MRLISALAILLLISSCAHNHLRLVKTGPRQIVKVEKKTKSKHSEKENEDLAVNYSENQLDRAFNSEEDNSIPELEVKTFSNTLQPQDSTGSDEPKISQEAYNEAMRAERNAKGAKNSFIVAFPVLLIPVYGWLASLILFAVGSLLYWKATNARYTTAEGQYQEEKARKWRLAYAIFLGIILLIAVASIVLILFF